MAAITKSSDAAIANAEYLIPIKAKTLVNLVAGDAVYQNADGNFEKAVRTVQFVSGSFGTQMKFAGLAARTYLSGSTAEAYGRGSEWFYADSGLNEGTAVYPSATAGSLDNSAAVANDNPIAMVVSTTNIRLIAGV